MQFYKARGDTTSHARCPRVVHGETSNIFEQLPAVLHSSEIHVMYNQINFVQVNFWYLFFTLPCRRLLFLLDIQLGKLGMLFNTNLQLVTFIKICCFMMQIQSVVFFSPVDNRPQSPIKPCDPIVEPNRGSETNQWPVGGSKVNGPGLEMGEEGCRIRMLYGQPVFLILKSRKS